MRLTAQDLIQNAIDNDPGLLEQAGFAIYDPVTGEIQSAGTMGRTFILEKRAAGEPCAITDAIPVETLTSFSDKHYVDLATGLIEGKNLFPGTLTGLTITGLPVPCRIGVSVPFQTGKGWWAPQWFDFDETAVDLTFDVPDTYRVVVESARYLRGEFTVVFDG